MKKLQCSLKVLLVSIEKQRIFKNTIKRNKLMEECFLKKSKK